MSDLISRNDALEMLVRVEKMHPYKVIGDFDSYLPYPEAWSECVSMIESYLEQIPSAEPEKKAPILKNGETMVCADYADGDGTILRKKWLDWVCPNCGWFVGEQYVPRRHNQTKSDFCSKCGQAIDWDAVEPERLERVCKWKKQMQLEEIKKYVIEECETTNDTNL